MLEEYRDEVDVPDVQTLTAALLDRLLHRARIVQLAGESYRPKGSANSSRRN